MAQESFGAVVRRRLYGTIFIALVAALVTLSILIYNKAFTTTVDVTLDSDHIGNQLLVDSDVKERGIIVGSVKSVTSHGTGAIVKLELDPTRVSMIPNNVRARILPKTLFGEQYVALSTPTEVDHAPAIAAGDTIGQDRSKGALEAQTVISDLYPLLTAVQPAQLNATLTALAQALHGRGEELGRTLVNFDHYLRVMNPHTTRMVSDLEKLGQVALEYNSVAPDIFATLNNLQTSAHTVIQREAGFHSLLVDGSDTANVLNSFLSENEQRLITINDQTNQIYPLLNQYSPEFSCLFEGVNTLYKGVTKAIYNNQIHLSVTADQQNLGPYSAGQEPRYIRGLGPQCFGLPNPSKPFQIPGKYRCINDGAPLTKDACAQSADAENKSINSAAENAYVDTLVAGQMHTTPNKVSGTATLLAGPMLRGQRVVVGK
jgi:phospholipid/cholesterol/gamma-HCH transport system substrate-binding protein